jgi:hypothetical protein
MDGDYEVRQARSKCADQTPCHGSRHPQLHVALPARILHLDTEEPDSALTRHNIHA